MIKPTIGRSLHFHAGSDADLKTFGGTGPFAAILAGVISDQRINVGVFTNEGTVVGRTNVQLLQGLDIVSEDESYCEWMPFQLGQAAGSISGAALHPMVVVDPATARLRGLFEKAAGQPHPDVARQLQQTAANLTAPDVELDDVGNPLDDNTVADE